MTLTHHILLWAVAMLVFSPAEARIACRPSVLNLDDILQLDFGRDHPEELAVIAPDGAYFFIARRRLDGEPFPLGIPSRVFKGIKTMSLEVQTFEAARAQKGAPTSERVFTRPGRYRFLMADRLESEEVDWVQTCHVELRLR